MTLRQILSAVALCIMLALPTSADAADITGTPTIVDGDTVAFGGQRVRLGAITAPETDQQCLDAKGEAWACGVAAREALQSFGGGKPWVCRTIGSTQFGRAVARCTAGGEDVEQWMVKNGWALASAREAKGYGKDEAEARTTKVGLWAGAFVSPRDWRRRKNDIVLGDLKITAAQRASLLRSAAGDKPSSPECAIKGNVNRSGVCVYHTPGGRYYAKIKMDGSRSDNRWFCSVAEAQASGCRETKR